MKQTALLIALVVCSFAGSIQQATAQGSSFTYQGQLVDQGVPANGSYDFQFNLFAIDTGGSPLTGAVVNENVPVSNGLFTVTLDFGPGLFTGTARWLGIGVRPGTDAGAFTILAPRQLLLPTPYAIHSASVTASGINGIISAANIGDSSITSNKLAADSVTSAQIAAGSVTTSELANGSVTASRLAGSFQTGTINLAGTTNGTNRIVTFPVPFEAAPVVDLPLAPYLVPTNITTTNFEVVIPPHRLNLDGGPNDVGRYVSMALVGGNPAIAYSDDNSGDLKYVRATNPAGSTWGAPVVADVGGASLVGKYASLAVVNGRPAIAYMDDTADNLLYIRANDATGATWPASPVTVASAGDVGHYAQLKVVNGIPAIAYFDNTTSSLQFIRANNADGTTWPAAPITVEQGDSTNAVGQYASMEIVNGNPAIAYRSDGLDVLRYSRATNADGSGWDPPTNITASIPKVKEVSLTMAGGRPAVAYVARETEVRYERSSDTNGTFWNGSVFLVGAARDISPSGVVARETNNVVHVAFWHGQRAEVMYTRANINGFFEKPLQLLGGAGGTSGGTVAMLALSGRVIVGASSGSDDLFFTSVAVPQTSTTPYTARNATSIEADSVASGSITREMLAPSVFGSVITSGRNSFAVGTFSRALYDDAFAAGENAVASGQSSFAGGRDVVAANFGSVALGDGAQAIGSAAVALGNDTIASGDSATALGDSTVATGTASLAAGTRAKANHTGTFVWSDTSTGDFASTANNQFLIRTTDGVGINTNNPVARLHLNGTMRVENGATFAGGAAVEGTLVTDNLNIGGFARIIRSSIAPAANSTLTPVTGYVELTPTANVTLNATTAIANGTSSGQVLILQGNGSFTVTVPDNANTRLPAAAVLGDTDVLMLLWDGSDWIQMSFSNNN